MKVSVVILFSTFFLTLFIKIVGAENAQTHPTKLQCYGWKVFQDRVNGHSWGATKGKRFERIFGNGNGTSYSLQTTTDGRHVGHVTLKEKLNDDFTIVVNAEAFFTPWIQDKDGVVKLETYLLRKNESGFYDIVNTVNSQSESLADGVQGDIVQNPDVLSFVKLQHLLNDVDKLSIIFKNEIPDGTLLQVEIGCYVKEVEVDKSLNF